jgi:signal transduction histidine kinase
MKNRLNKQDGTIKHFTCHKLNIITAAMIAAVLCMSLAISYIIFKSLDFNQYDNSVRLLVEDQKNQIEKEIYNRGDYPYIVFDLTGKVVYSDSKFQSKVGDIINVQEMLQYDKSFASQYKNYRKESFVLQKAGEVDRFVVFLVPESELFRNTAQSNAWLIYLPLIVGAIISIALLIIKVVYQRYRIFKPLRDISCSAKAIIAGNYDIEVLRTYSMNINDNEVGELSYAFELMRDELKAKQIKEEALKSSQKELISCISHDLKTPISTIKAYSEGLRDHIAKNPEQQAEFIGIIINKTDLLIGMINELLECSTAQLNQLDIIRDELYFSDYFDPLMSEIEVYVSQNGFHFTYSSNLPQLLVSIDSKRITEVIYNLVENSMKYRNDRDGRITIETERVDMAILVKVKDNGPGISAADIPYVFDMFYRAEKSRSSSIPGSGLGLSICKYIINEHGGEIYCKSTSMKGCEIGFTLPLL